MSSKKLICTLGVLAAPQADGIIAILIGLVSSPAG